MPDSAELLRLLELSPLERYSLASLRESREERRKVFTCYLSMREKISNDYLPVVNSAVPFINDHSRQHLRRVLRHIEHLLERHFPIGSGPVHDVPAERLLTWSDVLILLNALVWHDMGNMYGREGHAKVVKECFAEVSGRLYDEYLAGHVARVAEAHSGEGAIERVIPNSHASVSYRGEDVHPQFLAAVLRFADELDEDVQRISPADWRTHIRNGKPLVPPASHRYWYFSERNISIAVNTVAGAHNLQHVVRIVSHIPRSDFDTPFDVENGEPIRALAEYFRRLFKIAKEREYCNRYIRKAYYHPGVALLHIHLETHEPSASPSPDECFEFELSDDTDPEALLTRPRLGELHGHIREALAVTKVTRV